MKAKPGELRMFWNRGERDVGVAWGSEGATKQDANLLMGVFGLAPCFTGKILTEELADRGYDLATLRFSIKQKPRADQQSQANKSEPA
jgi:hypothetical protein